MLAEQARSKRLRAMGISQWQLAHPERLKGLATVAAVSVDETARCLVITDENMNLQTPFWQDVKQALAPFGIAENAWRTLSFEMLQTLNLSQPVVMFFLDDKNQLETAPADLPQNDVWRASPKITTSTLEHLQQSSTQKRALWQQIQQIPFFE